MALNIQHIQRPHLWYPSHSNFMGKTMGKPLKIFPSTNPSIQPGVGMKKFHETLQRAWATPMTMERTNFMEISQLSSIIRFFYQGKTWKNMTQIYGNHPIIQLYPIYQGKPPWLSSFPSSESPKVAVVPGVPVPLRRFPRAHGAGVHLDEVHRGGGVGPKQRQPVTAWNRGGNEAWSGGNMWKHRKTRENTWKHMEKYGNIWKKSRENTHGELSGCPGGFRCIECDCMRLHGRWWKFSIVNGSSSSALMRSINSLVNISSRCQQLR